MNENKKTILVTGSAGFIGFHVSKYLLIRGWHVIGIDGITDYYDIKLKKDRHQILSKFDNFVKYEFMLENFDELKSICSLHKPEIIIHLAAQAGVRFSIENPKSYLQANIIGTFNILEVSKLFEIKHLLISSSSSVYGNQESKPLNEKDNTDYPISFYAASKKSCETLSHSYSYTYKIPITILRFFTVYGPWGRPDMAIFKFTKNILNDKEIEVYNYGEMKRDFTYIDDIVLAVCKLINKVPLNNCNDYMENVHNYVPLRTINIGNSNPVELKNFIKLIEKNLNKKSIAKFTKNQKGDVLSTWADTSLLEDIIKFKPKTSLEQGIKKFVQWYLEYYK